LSGSAVKPAIVQVESHPYLPEWGLPEFYRDQGIVLLAFAVLGNATCGAAGINLANLRVARRKAKSSEASLPCPSGLGINI